MAHQAMLVKFYVDVIFCQNLHIYHIFVEKALFKKMKIYKMRNKWMNELKNQIEATNELMKKIIKIDKKREWPKECKFGMNEWKKNWTKRFKFWNDWMDGWKNERKEARKKGRNEWMNQNNEILRILGKSNLKWWIYAKLELEKCLHLIFHSPMQWQERQMDIFAFSPHLYFSKTNDKREIITKQINF